MRKPRPPTPTDRRAIIYSRVSTQRQSEEGVSLDAQEERCRDYCRLHGLEVVAVLREEGVSGFSVPLAQRPEGRRLVAMLAAGEATHVVAYSLSRIFRSAIEAQTLTRDWDAAGYSTHLLDFGGQAIDTRSAAGRMIFGVLATMGQFERDVTAERVTLALDRIASTGRKPTGPLYGYRRQDKALVPHEPEASEVRRMFRAIAKGQSLFAVAQDLNRRRVPTPRRSRDWSITGVRQILRRVDYTGRIVVGGEAVKASHKALVTLSLWREVQAILDGRYRLMHGRQPHHYAVLFRCGACGRVCRPQIVTRRGRTTVHVVCTQLAAVPAEERHPMYWYREDALMLAVWDDVAAVFSGDRIARAVERAAARSLREDKRAAGLRDRLEVVEGELARLVTLAARGTVASDVIDAQARPLTQEREDLLARLAATEPPEGLAEWQRLARETDAAALVARVQSWPVEQQLAWLRGIYECLELRGRELVLRYLGGMLPERVVPLGWIKARPEVDEGMRR